MSYVALLRAINVGGRNTLPMKDLVRIFEAAGCANVRTYIQSGNVVFDGPAALLKKLPSQIPAAIEHEFGFATPVILRSHAQMECIAQTNPFLSHTSNEKLLHVAFLADVLTPTARAALETIPRAPDEFAIDGREIYLYLPNGVSGSALVKARYDAKLGVASSARNWTTVRTLLGMM